MVHEVTYFGIFLEGIFPSINHIYKGLAPPVFLDGVCQF